MDNKVKIKENLQKAVTELQKLMQLQDSIQANWNDDISKVFEEKYKQIEKNINELVNEITELEKLI
jgi:uncharacterized protein YukE